MTDKQKERLFIVKNGVYQNTYIDIAINESELRREADETVRKRRVAYDARLEIQEVSGIALYVERDLAGRYGTVVKAYGTYEEGQLIQFNELDKDRISISAVFKSRYSGIKETSARLGAIINPESILRYKVMDQRNCQFQDEEGKQHGPASEIEFIIRKS